LPECLYPTRCETGNEIASFVITRLYMDVKHEVNEEILANTLAVMGVHTNKLAHLQKRKITYKEEVHQLKRAMTLQI
jgi:hypothetical protein